MPKHNFMKLRGAMTPMAPIIMSLLNAKIGKKPYLLFLFNLFQLPSGSVMPTCELDADLPRLPCGHLGVPTRDIAIQGKLPLFLPTVPCRKIYPFNISN